MLAFAESVVDSCHGIRDDPQEVESFLNNPTTVFICSRHNPRGMGFLMRKPFRVQFKLKEDVDFGQVDAIVFLGIRLASQTPVFAVLLQELIPGSEEFISDLRRMIATKQDPDFEEINLVSLALSLLEWNRVTKFCSFCAGSLDSLRGGIKKHCSSCKLAQYPRIDPSIIVLILNPSGEKVLLARSPQYPKKMMTLVSGFLDASESVELAVIREVKEEVGLDVDAASIRYVTSQSWTAGRSLMLGCIARVSSETIVIADPKEIEMASWFERSQVLQGLSFWRDPDQNLDSLGSTEFFTPPPGLMAHFLLMSWISGKLDSLLSAR